MVAGFAAAMTKFRLTVALFQFPSVCVFACEGPEVHSTHFQVFMSLGSCQLPLWIYVVVVTSVTVLICSSTILAVSSSAPAEVKRGPYTKVLA